MSYQCTRCMLQSFDVQQPRRCARCGGRAFGWLPTGAPRPESRSDDARPAAAAGAADVVSPGDDAPTLETACRQEGGFVSERLGHVRGLCSFKPGHDGKHSWEPDDDDDAPATPRDMPGAEDRAGFDTLSYELAREERLAGEAADQLGGVKCGEQGCERSATHKFFWPSPDAPPTRFACEAHAKRAGEISATLGFDADPQPL